MKRLALVSLFLMVPSAHAQELPVVRGVEGQPLTAQVMRFQPANRRDVRVVQRREEVRFTLDFPRLNSFERLMERAE